jgi:hypothetical protein
MVYVVKIDNKTKKGRLAVEFLRTLDDKSISFMEEGDDPTLLAIMKKRTQKR